MDEPLVEDRIWVRVNDELREVRRRMTADSTEIEVDGQWYQIASHPVLTISDVRLIRESDR